MNSLLILTEAGANIGFGHYTRCTAIANRWAKKYSESPVKMLLHEVGGTKLQVAHGQHFDWRANLPKVLASTSSYDAVLVDSYLATESELARLREAFKLCAVIDDYQRMAYPVHLVINPNVHGNKLDTTAQTGQWIGGPKYIILREAFRKRVKNKVRTGELKRVAVTVGGSDYRSLLRPLTKWMAQAGLEVKALCGNAERAAAVQAAFGKNSGVEALGLLDAKAMYNAFDWADVVITAAGQTTHELASMGKPSIAFSIDHDQDNNLNFYHNAGFLLDALHWDDADFQQKILAQLQTLRDESVQKKVGKAGKAAVDGKGVKRIVKLIKGYGEDEA